VYLHVNILATSVINYLCIEAFRSKVSIPYASACEAESPEHRLFWARPGVAGLGSCRSSLWQRSDHVTVARLRVHVCSLTLPPPNGLGHKLHVR
jgi:hypothetical protein